MTSKVLDFLASEGVDLASEGGPGQQRWTWLLAKQKERIQNGPEK
jgi:hypothetical protein